MRKTLLVVLAVGLMLSLTASVYAQAEPISPLTNLGAYQATTLHPEKDSTMFTSEYLKSINGEADTYEDSPVNKMGLGMINAATSWTELPRQVARVSEEDNALVGWTLGFGEGLVSGLARGMSGALDMATFGVPPYDKPLMSPEYSVKQPNKGFKIELIKW
jgi:putative exosortase-associated protein (TIGR04073 family)